MARVKVTTDSPTGFGGVKELWFDFERMVENVAGVSWWNNEQTVLTVVPYSKIHKVEIFKE